MAEKQPEHPPAQPDEMAPDPDEDDLSDLDDMLEEFSAANIKDKKSTTSTNPAAAAATAPVPSDPLPPSAASQPPQPSVDDNDFARELQAGMAGLFGQLDSNPEMQKQFEAMMSELTAAAAQDASVNPAAAAPPAQSSSSDKPPTAANFQDTIKKTMERMQNSGDTASAAAANASDEDILAQMLKEMESGNFSGMDGQNPEDFNSMLMGMMEQLTNKDILYEPMKELHDKFPEWLEKNSASTPQQDLTRYKDQQKIVNEIVARFEKKEYSDDNKQDREYIVEKMQQMQAAGAPPADLVGDMSSAQDALGDMDSGCNQQ